MPTESTVAEETGKLEWVYNKKDCLKKLKRTGVNHDLASEFIDIAISKKRDIKETFGQIVISRINAEGERLEEELGDKWTEYVNLITQQREVVRGSPEYRDIAGKLDKMKTKSMKLKKRVTIQRKVAGPLYNAITAELSQDIAVQIKQEIAGNTYTLRLYINGEKVKNVFHSKSR